MEDSSDRRIPWSLFVSELIGTALLVLVGLSLVILMFGTGTPMASLIPSERLRRLISNTWRNGSTMTAEEGKGMGTSSWMCVLALCVVTLGVAGVPALAQQPAQSEATDAWVQAAARSRRLASMDGSWNGTQDRQQMQSLDSEAQAHQWGDQRSASSSWGGGGFRR